jgi:hypothetical protein
MTEVNGSELLAFVDEALSVCNGDKYSALFALNDLVEEEEEYRTAIAV